MKNAILVSFIVKHQSKPLNFEQIFETVNSSRRLHCSQVYLNQN